MSKLIVFVAAVAALAGSIVPAFAGGISLGSVPPAGTFEGGPGAINLGAYAYPGDPGDPTYANEAVIAWMAPVEVPSRATTIYVANQPPLGGAENCNVYDRPVVVAGYMAPLIDARIGAAWPTCQ